MIHNKSAADYARARLNGHYENVCSLFETASTFLGNGGRRSPDTSLLRKLEQKDNLFPWIGDLL